MKTKVKGRVLAILMSMAMVFTMMSQTAYADDQTYTYTIQVKSGDAICSLYDKAENMKTFQQIMDGEYDLLEGCYFRRSSTGDVEYKFPSSYPEESVPSKTKFVGWSNGISTYGFEPGEEVPLSNLFTDSTTTMTITPVFKDISCGENLDWSISDGVLSIAGSGDMYDFGNPIDNNSERISPWYEDVNSFTKLKFFDKNDSGSEITSGLTHIGDYAFANTNLSYVDGASLVIPSKVKSIGKSAFKFCESLGSIIIPDGVTTIGEGAFYGDSSLSEITIPESVMSIGDEVFKGCEKLTTIYYGGTRKQWDELVAGKTLGLSSGVDIICAYDENEIELDSEVFCNNVNTKDAKTIYMAGNAWRVIGYNSAGVASSEDTMTLIASDNLKADVKFNTIAESSYMNSTLHKEIKNLTDGENTVFSDGEKAGIVPRNLETEGYKEDPPYTNGIAGDTVENALLWPLSTKEAHTMNNVLREANEDWWLCSPGKNIGNVALVSSSGVVNYEGDDSASNEYGVRPAFNYNLKFVLFTSAAEGGKDSDYIGANALAKVNKNTTKEWKLTLFDESRKFAVTRETASGKPGDTLSFNYTDATVNDPIDAPNEYISAMIVNSDGDVLYYGKLTKPESASGKVHVKIPSDLSDGTYKLKLFSEQYNGDKKTDFAGTFSDVKLTVDSDSACEVTYEVENGTWEDGSTDPIIESVAEGQSPTNIPASMKAEDGYKNGSWNIDPSSVTITGPTTFTYRFKDNKYQIHTDDLTDGQLQNIYFGKYKQSSDNNGGYKTKPVKWRVLANSNGSYLLLSDKNLDTGAYHSSDMYITWKDSAMRGRLNSDFLSAAFSNNEKKQIRNTSVLNSEGNGVDSTPGGNNTKDKIFLLSMKEATTPSYGFVEDVGESETRKAQGTDYTAGTIAQWLLRSPGDASNKVSYVDANGGIHRSMTVNDTNASVRPAMSLSKDSILFYSKADGGKGKTVGSISPVLENMNNNEWKLTLLDSTRNFGVKLYDVTGSKRTIRWFGAETGDNEYLSAIIKNQYGVITHYGRLKNLADNSDSTGTTEIDLSDISMEGKTLYVFNEQCNKGKMTDYSSSLKEPEQVSKHTVKYEIVNGTWADDTDAQKIEQVYNGDKPENVPAGMKETYGYKGGVWYQEDKKLEGTPANIEISGDVTFKYKFEPKTKYTVTYEVVNGVLGQNDKRTEEVYEGDQPKNIPKDMKPDCKYEGSSWNIDPATVTITNHTMFIYTFVKHDWEFTGFTWTGGDAGGYTGALSNYKCKQDTSHTTAVEAEFSEKITKPTCTEGGKTTYTATVKKGPDGKNRTESKDVKATKATGHTWDAGRITKPATTTATGTKTYTCNICKATKTETIAKLPKSEEPKKPDKTKEHEDPKEQKKSEKQYGTDGTPVGPGASIEAADKAIANTTSDKDIPGTRFATLKFKSSSQGKTNIKLNWTKDKRAAKYVVYGNLCNAGSKKYNPVKIATVNSSAINVNKIESAKVKKGTYYKFVIVAIDKNNKVVSTSRMIYVTTKGGKAGNYKSVTIKAKVNAKGKAVKRAKSLSKTVMKKGESLKLTVKTNPAAKKLKVKKYVGLRYETTNAKIATVSGNKIKAKGKGKCYVFAYTQNGVYKKLKVTVK